ncbi:GNAT family N-acetyltransferase [Tuberibacillus sp. Marseille-P3662]|uniref:GNAT family N-acetyltransferase n=1 Tax=Tuberibacillus sp. Marseille-P3662 TaxID=1965358 RepID=UPI000A1CEC4F|nr:GNAT family N-acetyltransferase [Tuberibacillus sp. Marseille-P3662]
MDWYKKLNKYFPIEEMKSKEHMELLLKEKPEMYHKDESSEHVLMYAETADFLFIDYIWVSGKTRGQGTGHKLMQKLKDKGKPIILEVEPVDYDDSDSEKRLKFYRREDFKHACSIGYRRKSLATNEVNEMEILYWSPTDESEESILEKMKKTYEEIHTYKDEQIYGESYEDVDDVLTIQDDKEDNILETFDTERPSS